MGNHAGGSHLSEHIDLFEVGRRKIEIIVRFERDVLGEVPPQKELFKIHRHAVALPHQKRSLQVRDFNKISVLQARFQSPGAGNRLNDGGGSVQSEHSLLHDAAEQEIFFAAERGRRDDRARRAIILGQRLVHFGPQFVNRQPGRHDVLRLQIIDAAVRPDADAVARQFLLAEERKVQHITRTEREALLPGRAPA